MKELKASARARASLDHDGRFSGATRGLMVGLIARRPRTAVRSLSYATEISSNSTWSRRRDVKIAEQNSRRPSISGMHRLPLDRA
jgi:hypothetical protein